MIATEFPTFGALPFDPTQYGLADTSWHNDACPSFSVINAKGVHEESLWVEFADKAERETGCERFHYSTYCPKGQHNEPLEDLLDTEDAAVAEQFLKDRLAKRLGDRFAALLRKDIGAKNFKAVQRANLVHKINGENSICASHDFCDANMVMLAAYAEVMSVKEDDVDPNSEAVLALFTAGWDAAKRDHITEKHEAPLRAPEVVRALIKHIPDGANDKADAAIALGKTFLKQPDAATNALKNLYELMLEIDAGEHASHPAIVSARSVLVDAGKLVG